MEAVARWDRLGVDPLLAKRKRVVAVDLPGEVHLEEDSHRRHRRDSDREDRAGRVIGLVRYCPVAAVDTAATHADYTASVAEPNPAAAADVHRTEAVPALAALAILQALARVVHLVPPVAPPHSDRSCWGNDAAGDVAGAADGIGAGSSGSGFGLEVAVGRRGVVGSRGACTAVVVGGLEGSSSRVCRRLDSERTGRMGACWGRGGSAGTAGAASAVGRTSGDAAGASDDAVGADGGACLGRDRLCYW